ncbi:Fic family protein [Phreatobacter cathodiphilus]|nr:Fic family protein [Phreatobacter cathodiphilus]
MPVIRSDTHGDLFAQITSLNLERQQLLLRDSIAVALRIPFRIDEHLVLALHAACATFLVERPGRYRTEPVFVSYSDRLFPDPEHVPTLVRELIVDVYRRWHEDDPFTLAAYALWRLNWIHPFDDANGRTARAVAVYIVSVKFGRWMPGRIDALQIIKGNHDRYVAALQHADRGMAPRRISWSR